MSRDIAAQEDSNFRTDITAHCGLFKHTHLHVDDIGGSGRTVVLIHAWPLSGNLWSKQVPASVEAGCRVVTYDRRGFGRSDQPATVENGDTLTDTPTHSSQNSTSTT